MLVKAAVLNKIGLPPPYATSRPLEIVDLDLAPPGRGEVLVRIRAAGLCHSDLSVIDGSRPRPTPMALGHEAAGIVEALGEFVTDLAVGDHVVLVFVPSCGRCGPCAAGRPALCEPGAKANGAGTLLSGERRLSFRAEPINHHLGVSAFGDHAVVARESCVKIDPEPLFGCAVLTGVGAVVNTARVEPGCSVAVVGLGGVGLSAVLGARVAGARQIVAVDLSDEKLAFARALGATHLVNAGAPDAVQTIRGLTGGGVEIAFDMAGAVPALELAYAATARGGTTVTAGLIAFVSIGFRHIWAYRERVKAGAPASPVATEKASTPSLSAISGLISSSVISGTSMRSCDSLTSVSATSSMAAAGRSR